MWKEALSASEQPPWAEVAAALRAERLGQQAHIAADVIRSSNSTMLLGSSGKVEVIDHGVIFRFDATQQMYSSGNVTERHRMGHLDLRGETVVVAFSGIGYSTLPMLVRGGAEHVHACDINPLQPLGCSRVHKQTASNIGSHNTWATTAPRSRPSRRLRTASCWACCPPRSTHGRTPFAA